MRDRFKILIALLLFWMAFFTVARATFLLYNIGRSTELSIVEILKSMTYGMKMDFSMSGYFVLFSGLLVVVTVFVKSKWLDFVVHLTQILFLLFACLVIMVDLELYKHWGFRMNITPLFYMSSEGAGSVDSLTTLKLVLIAGALFSVFVYFYKRKIVPAISKLLPAKPAYAWVLLAFIVLLLIPIRGGVGASTMNVGRVYYHKSNMFANHAGINVVWNFLYSLTNDNSIMYPEDFFDKALTQKRFSELYPAQDSTYSVLSVPKPNILLILLESFTSDVVEPLGGLSGIAPNLNALCAEGILFDQFYSSGDRTDKGLVSVLSGFPAQPRGSIIKFPQKTQRLPFLSSKLEDLGYQSSFIYGGDADFANYRSFLTAGRFGHITSEDDFASGLSYSKWGVHDEYVFRQTLVELDSTTRLPFFKVVLTLSSHEPGDVPMETVIHGDDKDSKFLNSCHYTDIHLGQFIAEAKTKPWWNNTLIIITADHGHHLPGNKNYESKEKFRIPMLWLGGVIQKDTVIHTLGNHTDIANTLLAQIDKPSPEFLFSKNLLGTPVKDFAMYVFNSGYGYLEPTKYFIYDNPGKQYLKRDGMENETDLEYAKAYIQTLYSEYNAKK